MNYEKEPNLDLNNSDVSWNVSSERDLRSIGNKIISTPETVPREEVEFGKIIPADMSLPPTHKEESNPSSPTPVFNYSTIRVDKDRISKHAINEIIKLEDKLAQDGDLNSFYAAARDMTSAYLDNSFNRKLAA